MANLECQRSGCGRWKQNGENSTASRRSAILRSHPSLAEEDEDDEEDDIEDNEDDYDDED